MLGPVMRTLGHLTAEQRRVHAQHGWQRSQALEIGRRQGLVGSSDPGQVIKLSRDHSQAVTNGHDLEVEDTRLTAAQAAILGSDSDQYVALPRRSQQATIKLTAGLGGRKRIRPQQIPRAPRGQ